MNRLNFFNSLMTLIVSISGFTCEQLRAEDIDSIRRDQDRRSKCLFGLCPKEDRPQTQAEKSCNVAALIKYMDVEKLIKIDSTVLLISAATFAGVTRNNCIAFLSLKPEAAKCIDSVKNRYDNMLEFYPNDRSFTYEREFGAIFMYFQAASIRVIGISYVTDTQKIIEMFYDVAGVGGKGANEETFRNLRTLGNFQSPEFLIKIKNATEQYCGFDRLNDNDFRRNFKSFYEKF